MSTKAVSVLFLLLSVSLATAQTAKNATHMTPSGKGWGVENENGPGEQKPFTVTTGNGISYHGGPVLPANPVPVYFIWYGNWSNGPRPSDSATTVNLLTTLYGSNGLNNSGYEKINTTYGDNTHNVSGGVLHSGTDQYPGYSNGTRLKDSTIRTIVANYINSMQNGAGDPNGIYFVLTSSDVNETSGFCTKYCGWHTNGTINGLDIKYSFVGNPDRCPSACEWQTTSPNGDSGADGMASVMAHETEEAISDPDLNAWYDSSGAENADKCAWKWGPTQTSGNGSIYNQTIASHNWLIQMNWENARGGGCDQTLGGAFYTQ